MECWDKSHNRSYYRPSWQFDCATAQQVHIYMHIYRIYTMLVLTCFRETFAFIGCNYSPSNSIVEFMSSRVFYWLDHPPVRKASLSLLSVTLTGFRCHQEPIHRTRFLLPFSSRMYNTSIHYNIVFNYIQSESNTKHFKKLLKTYLFKSSFSRVCCLSQHDKLAGLYFRWTIPHCYSYSPHLSSHILVFDIAFLFPYNNNC